MSTKTTLSICIVTWNSRRYLNELLSSIFSQTIFTKEDYPVKVSINMVDSGSADGTTEYILNKYPQVHILKNTHNRGFSTSYNQAIRMGSSEYVLVLNADISLEPDYIETLLEKIKKNDEIAAISGKLLRASFDTSINTDEPVTEKTKVIDSLGLKGLRNRRFINIEENKEYSGQLQKDQPVFGMPAVALLFRKEALEDIKYNNEYFDEDFFSYREDIDISWRLQIAGYKTIITPDATAYHFRSTRNNVKKYSNLTVAKKYKSKDKLVRYWSYRNHLMCLFKNETKRNFFKDFFPIVWFEFRKLIYLLLFDWNTLKGLFHALSLRKKMKNKRKPLMAHRKIKAQLVGKWFK